MKEAALFSVIVPAHNEENYIGKCLKAIRTAEEQSDAGRVQIIVVANRCTDQTAEIAEQYDAEVIENQDKCIASIRNAGAKAAAGKILVTVDADTYIAPETFKEIRSLLGSGKYIGGGAIPTFDRASLGIFVSTLVVAVNLLPTMIKEGGLSGAMFWTYTKAFKKIRMVLKPRSSAQPISRSIVLASNVSACHISMVLIAVEVT